MNIHVVRHCGEFKDGVRLEFAVEGSGASGCEHGFSAKVGRAKLCAAPDGTRLVIGLGKAEELDMDGFRAAVALAMQTAASQELPTLVVDSGHVAGIGLGDTALTELIISASLAGYRFTAFKSSPDDADSPCSLTLCGDTRELDGRLAQASALVEGVTLARDLVNTPANAATPEYLAEVALELGRTHGFGVEVLGPEEITALGMGCFAAVFRGSEIPPRFIILDSKPGSTERPMVFIGKGVTFDTGGISLKPAAKMHEMKGDMAGAAAVLGLFKAMGRAGQEMPRVVGLLPCTENAPGSRATKPGDVVTAMNGTTVEILNTDAEGRLLLADALCYSARFKPAAIVDLATLTGACLVALGPKVAAVFANTAALDRQIREGGSRVGERFWPMPLWKEYGARLKSDVADLKNIATREGGAIYAALFLKHFVPDGVDWAHLDIAGPAWSDESTSIYRAGGTGFGVRTLWELVRGQEEDGAETAL